MLGQYYYHEILRKTIIGFGTLFNNIQLRHQDANGKDISAIKVPLAYGPAQKFLARIEQGKTNERDIAITLPRMSFEMTGIEYDATRKTGITQTFKTTTKPSGDMKKVFMPVPYTLSFSLSIFTKFWSIIETILLEASFVPILQLKTSAEVSLIVSNI